MTATRSGAKRHRGRDYYASLHQSSLKYQQNNWLLEDLPALVAAGGDSIIEIGCGNGLFLERAVEHWPRVVGVDWVRSERLDAVLAQHPNIGFLQQDLTALEVDGRFDLLASADVLEHLDPSALPGVIARLHAQAHRCYHKIACYDDGHSHLSVFRPARWLQIFQAAVPDGDYHIVSRHYRKRGRKKAVVVIANVPRKSNMLDA